MVERRRLPPQIKRVELTRRAGGRPVVRCQPTVDVGIVDGKRKQLRKLQTIRGDRNRHAGHLALYGLRRGEIGGLRWTNVDFEAQTLTIGHLTPGK